MKPTNTFTAACLAAGLAVVWTSPAGAATDNLTLNASPSVSIYDAYFLYGGNTGGVYSATATPLGNLAGGGILADSINFSAVEPAGNPATFVGTVLGLYDTGNGFVTLGFTDYNGSLLTTTPTSFSNALLTPYSESQLATALLAGDTATLDSFYAAGRVQAIAGVPVGGSGVLINFSLSSPNGIFSVSPSPEPATLSLLGLGAAALLCVRRSRRG